MRRPGVCRDSLTSTVPHVFEADQSRSARTIRTFGTLRRYVVETREGRPVAAYRRGHAARGWRRRASSKSWPSPGGLSALVGSNRQIAWGGAADPLPTSDTRRRRTAPRTGHAPSCRRWVSRRGGRWAACVWLPRRSRPGPADVIPSGSPMPDAATRSARSRRSGPLARGRGRRSGSAGGTWMCAAMNWSAVVSRQTRACRCSALGIQDQSL
jgi:hypothetical protein